jgi:hypothetical protein
MTIEIMIDEINEQNLVAEKLSIYNFTCAFLESWTIADRGLNLTDYIIVIGGRGFRKTHDNTRNVKYAWEIEFEVGTSIELGQRLAAIGKVAKQIHR